MAAYGEYYEEQTEEFFSNPVFVIDQMGSEKSGVAAARWLRDETRPELFAAVAEVLHVDAATVRAALRKENYHGPLQLLVDNELWAELVAFAAQDEHTLWECPSVPRLRELVWLHYSPLLIANVRMEELVKAFKNLTPQARAHPAGAETRLCWNARTQPSQFGMPEREELKEIRKALGHYLPSRAREKQLPPVPEDEISELTWSGATNEEGFDSDHEEEEGRDDNDGGDAGTADDQQEPEEDEEDDGEPDAEEEDERDLEQLRAQAIPIKDRKKLSKDRGFLCWDNKEKTSFFPLVLTEDWAPRMVKIKCACLEPRGQGVYTIDPSWQGETDRNADKAFINLIFEVQGEGLREVAGGIEMPQGPMQAWKMQRV